MPCDPILSCSGSCFVQHSRISRQAGRSGRGMACTPVDSEARFGENWRARDAGDRGAGEEERLDFNLSTLLIYGALYVTFYYLVLFQQGNVPNGAGSVDFIHSKAVIIPNFEDDASLWQQNWYDVPRDPGGRRDQRGAGGRARPAVADCAGRTRQLAGTVLFVLNMWWRVRMPPAAGPPAR